MKKHQIKLRLSRLSVPDKIEFGRTVYKSMLMNPNFVSPVPTLDDLKTVTDELESAFNSAQGAGPLQTSLMYEKEEAFDTLMTALGNEVAKIARGNEAIILSSGMLTRRLKSPSPVPGRVENVETTSVSSGELIVTWTPMPEAYSFLGYIKLEGEADEQYRFVIKTTRSFTTVSGLKSGSKYCIIIEALGPGGVGALSDAASSFVL